MKLISWNVNGLRAVMNKNFMEVFRTLDADCFCLQETKLQEGQIDFDPEGYYSYWNYADKKGYSGTAIFTKVKPISVTRGMGIDEHDHEGRVLTLEFKDFYLTDVYVPNSQDELKRLDYRMRWEDAFRNYQKELEKTKPVVFCGDLNVAHQEIDIKNPKTNHRNPGYTEEERGHLSKVSESGFVDTFRYLYPETVTYSWWSYRFKARERNTGWRIDYFICSESLKDKIRDAKIHTDIMGSDHCPVELDLEI